MSGSGVVDRDWEFPTSTDVLDVNPAPNMMAIGSSTLDSVDGSPHQITLIRLSDRTEVRHWNLPQSVSYKGRFAKTGSTFCAAFWSDARSKQELTCWAISNGDVQRKIPVQFAGAATPLLIGGSKIGINEAGVIPIPNWLFRLAETNAVITRQGRVVWDLQNRQKLAEWPIRSQQVRPFNDNQIHCYPFAISPDGTRLLEGGAGQLTSYRFQK